MCVRGACPRLVRMQSTQAWKPVLKPGVMPVYDEALKFIQQDTEALREQLAQVKSDASENAQHRAYALEVASEINNPSVREKFRNGDCM